MTSPGAPQKFPLGELLMTPGAAAAFERTGEQWSTFLMRHVHGDWGELDQHDIEENEYSVQRRLRLLSRYTLTDKTVIWIITEADRSATTILLPEEY
jgi:hypothetical protein